MSTPSDRVLAPFVELRARVAKSGWSPGDSRLLSDTLSACLVELAAEIPPRTAVVATGGYGRGFLALRSDVDLMFLTGSSPDPAFISRVLRPLWDAGLRVGHRVGGPRELPSLGERDLYCSLLTARLIAGDPGIYQEFVARFRKRVERSKLMKALESEERSRRVREPYRLMAMNLKSGRGGLRTLDAIDWVTTADQELREELLAVRSGLHAVTGRAHDVYDFELRHRVADWLGTDVRHLGEHLLEVTREVESLAEVVWPGLRRRREPPTRTIDRYIEALRANQGSDEIKELVDLFDVPHVVPFHRFAVLDHSLATVDELRCILDGRRPGFDVERIADPEALLWAGLLHDVGKAHVGDHCRIGEVLAADLAGRLQLRNRSLIAWLVGNHLLLAEAATRSNLDDPAELALLARRIGDASRLDHLYLLTVADSSATGSDIASAWRLELISRAYRRILAEMNGDGEPLHPVEAIVAQGVSEDQVLRHLAGFEVEYRRSHSPDLIATHIRLAESVEGGIAVEATPLGATTRLAIVTRDTPGLLTDLAGAMLIEGCSIIEARVATRSDGLAFDTFELVDAISGGPVDDSRIAGLSRRLRRMLRGGYELAGLIEDKKRAYGGGAPAASKVRIMPTPGGGGVIEIEASDRIGLLYDISATLGSMGVSIRRASIDTRGGIAYDTFWVQRLARGRLEPELLAVLG